MVDRADINDGLRVLTQGIPDPSFFGSKAAGLAWLHLNGYPVPYAIFLSRDETDITIDSLRRMPLPASPSPTYPLIVRSSSLNEDTAAASHAGEYESVADVDSWEALVRAIERVRRRDPQLPVIIQEQIAPDFAGVLFPSDPMTSAKSTSIIEVTPGFAGPMLAGHITPETIEVSDNTITAASLAIPRELLRKLRATGRAIEDSTAAPANIEWASVGNDVYFLQLRPVVNGQYQRGTLEAIDDRAVGSDDPKVRLRRLARSVGVVMSRAWLVHTSSTADISMLLRDMPSTGMYSVVLIEPPLLDGKVVRRFAPAADLQSAVTFVVNTALREFWKCTVIIKEVLDGIYTGIASRDDSGYWIEIAAGHFVPKGVVPVSTLRFNRDKQLVQHETRQQTHSYAISAEGATRHERDASSATLPLDTLATTLKAFDKIWDTLPSVLEFGIARDDTPYLIDYTPPTDVDARLVKTGVIAAGKGQGRLVRSDDSIDEQLSSEWHAKNAADSSSTNEAEDVIIAAKRPYIALLRYLIMPTFRVTGFVFEESGLLNHLALQLRERRIPAIVCTKHHIESCVGHIVAIDALSPSISGDARLTA